jgi:hypothetical protein
MFFLDDNQIAGRCGVGNSNHAANLLGRVAARCRFKNRCLAVQIHFSDHGQGNMVLPQKVFRLGPGQASISETR